MGCVGKTSAQSEEVFYILSITSELGDYFLLNFPVGMDFPAIYVICRKWFLNMCDDAMEFDVGGDTFFLYSMLSGSNQSEGLVTMGVGEEDLSSWTLSTIMKPFDQIPRIL